MFGPSDPELWQRRPLGRWESQLVLDFPPGVPGPRRCSIASVSQLSTDTTLDVSMWEESVQDLVYTEPQLRADVNTHSSPPCWLPATDFSQIFSFQDLSHFSCLEDIWHLVDEEANKPWDYGSGKPLFRHLLLRIAGGYVAINCYHHAAGDGTSGILMINSILSNYDILHNGGSLEKKSNKPLPSIEELTSSVKNNEILKRLVDSKIERAKTYRPRLPFSLQELEENNSAEIPLNKSIIRTGSEENYQAIRSRCRTEGVTVGSLALASSYLAMAAVEAESAEEAGLTYPGSVDQLVDIPVNMRNRLDQPLGNTHCGFLITEVTTKASVTANTKLWALTRELGGQVREMLEENQHFLFSQAKEQFETQPDTAELASSTESHCVLDVLVSNMMAFPGTLDYTWASLKSVHCVGSVWAPGFANFLLLFQSTKSFSYDLVYSPGSKNETVGRKLVEVFSKVMEDSHRQGEDYGFQEVSSLLKSQKF